MIGRWIVLLAVPVALSASAELKLAGPFTDGAVLQCGRKVPIWGWADPRQMVTVSFAGLQVSGVADSNGVWRVDLPPLEPCREGRVLTVRSCACGTTSKHAKEVRDVLVGEVWFVGGQSNAEMPLCGKPHFSDRNGRAVAQKTSMPLVRFCRQNAHRLSEVPCKLPISQAKWLPFSPENLQGDSFSAMGVYYGIELYDALQIPIGLVGVYWGGTGIDPWIPREGLASRPRLKGILDWKPSLKWDGEHPPSLWAYKRVKDQPSLIWNALVNPWCPYAMRGLIWYQGEANVDQPELYADQMHALYDGWSRKFENADMRLYYVQIAPYRSEKVVKLQLAQAQFEREEPNAGMVVVNDVGNLKDVHPNDKRTVGLRLALHALKRDYGFKSIRDNSPSVKAWRVEGNECVLTFNDANALYLYNADFSTRTPFEIAGEDGVFKPAVIGNLKTNANGRVCGEIDGAELRVRAEGVTHPVRLRYLHSRPWTGTVYNEANLPLGVFSIP